MTDSDVPDEERDTVPPEPPLPSSTIPSETQFAAMIRRLFDETLREHEAREMAAIEKMTKMVDYLVNDARSLHLHVADHESRLTRLEVDVGTLKDQLALLEERLSELKQL